MKKKIYLEAGLSYYKNLFDEQELESHIATLKNSGILIKKHDKTGIVMAHLDIFTNQIVVALSSPLIQAYILGLMTNASYEALKSTIIWMWRSTIGKTILKLNLGGRQEDIEATFGLHVSINKYTKIEFRLSGEISDELKSKCIDDAFQLIKKHRRRSFGRTRHFSTYDIAKKKWVIVNVDDEIRKLIDEKEMKKDNSE